MDLHKAILAIHSSVRTINGNTEKTIDSNDEHTEDQQQILKIVKDITSKGFVRNNFKKKLVDLSDIRINLKGKK